MRQPSLEVVASFFCALIKLWCHIFKASYDQQGGDIHRTEGINAYGECNILFVKLWMNSENDKNGNFNQNGVMNRESMATGVYFVPGLGQAALLATIAVGGAYGAWYLGKKLKTRANKRSWDHIKSEHGPKSNKNMPNGAPKSQFKNNKTMKRTTRSTGRTKPKYTQGDGLTVHIKKFKNG